MTSPEELDFVGALSRLMKWLDTKVTVAVQTTSPDGRPVVAQMRGTLTRRAAAADDDATNPVAFSFKEHDDTFELDSRSFRAAQASSTALNVDLGDVKIEVRVVTDDVGAAGDGVEQPAMTPSPPAEAGEAGVASQNAAGPTAAPDPVDKPEADADTGAPAPPEPPPTTPAATASDHAVRRGALRWILDHVIGGVVAGLLTALMLLLINAFFGPLFQPES